MANTHIQDELLRNHDRITVQTQYGPVIGGRASNGAVGFLGASATAWSHNEEKISHSRHMAQEIPYALPPARFEDPRPLPLDHRYECKEYIQETACEIHLCFLDGDDC